MTSVFQKSCLQCWTGPSRLSCITSLDLGHTMFVNKSASYTYLVFILIFDQNAGWIKKRECLVIPGVNAKAPYSTYKVTRCILHAITRRVNGVWLAINADQGSCKNILNSMQLQVDIFLQNGNVVFWGWAPHAIDTCSHIGQLEWVRSKVGQVSAESGQ